jgi:hypothetical protein
MSDDAPKSALELALERLRRKDREEGVRERPLTDEQRARIAQIRTQYEAKLAEIEILSRSSRSRAEDPETLERVEQQYHDERVRLAAERDHKIEAERRALVGEADSGS